MIKVKNFYQMLAYVLSDLQKNDYKKLEVEEFEDALELYSKILIQGVETQIKRGLGRSYITSSEELGVIRGKINVSESVKYQSMLRQKLICEYDEFSVNYYLNQIIRSTLELILKSNVSKKIKKDVRKVIIFFGDVKSLELKQVNWNQRYTRNNQSYRLLITMCYLIVHSLLQTENEGVYNLMDFNEVEKRHRIFQRFVEKYYQTEYPQLNAKAREIGWQLTKEPTKESRSLLPKMESDISMQYKDKVLILDTKYYQKALQTNQFGKATNISHNLYQIFTYVKNKEYELWKKDQKLEAEGKKKEDVTISGMLLYAMTDEEIKADADYEICGNEISVRMLDLNQEFAEIKRQLDEIVKNHFGYDLKSTSELRESYGF